MRSEEEQTSKVISDLCSILLTVIRSPTISSSAVSAAAAAAARLGSRRRRRPQMSAAGLTALLLGASLTMMLCGSLTFVIGLMLMPWVVGLGMLFSFFGILSSLSGIGKAMLCPGAPSRKEMTACPFSKCSTD